MIRKISFALPLLVMVGCMQELDSAKKPVFGGLTEEAMIKQGVEGLQIKSFYVPASEIDQKGITTEKSMADFTRENKSYEEKMLTAPSGQKQYRSFIEAKASDPNITTFRRQTAEKFLTKSPIAVAEKAYFTSELIAGRSSNIDLIRTSITELEGKVNADEHQKLVQSAQQLFTQYRAYYLNELARRQHMPVATYQQRSAKAIEIRFAELVLEQVQKNQQLLQAGTE